MDLLDQAIPPESLVMDPSIGHAARQRRLSLSTAPLTRVTAAAYTIPTDHPESDGTFAWRSTTLITVELEAGGAAGLGYTYGDRSTAALIRDTLAGPILGRDAFAHGELHALLEQATRNLGRPGLASMAIAALDVALWDLRGRLLDVPLLRLLGAARSRIPIYGSGGFTSYSTEELLRQLGGWAAAGFRRVKMKVGRDPDADLARVAAARAAIGGGVELFVDANGAYTRKQALRFAGAFADEGVTWFEEPVSSDDLAGLRLLRDRGPAGLDIAAGEYGYDLAYFARMLRAGAVDVLMADAGRCGGLTGFLRVAALCEAEGLPLSSHTAPMLHLAACCAAPRLVHLEYFHDHARIERMLFEGVIEPIEGTLAPDPTRPGLGLELKRRDAERYLAG
jgi:L-alanine-DL-glutamate epimerase-like enolase superfamily enzyme